VKEVVVGGASDVEGGELFLSTGYLMRSFEGSLGAEDFLMNADLRGVPAFRVKGLLELG
jgi:hypothetical protein